MYTYLGTMRARVRKMWKRLMYINLTNVVHQ